MRRISETEAQDRLHELLRAAAAGERIAITSSDGATAELGPAVAGDAEISTDQGAPTKPEPGRAGHDKAPAERQRAKERLVRRLRSQTPTGEPRDWTRDELYDDD